jgi:oligopeptidase A
MSDTTLATSADQANPPNPLLDFSDLPRFGEIKPEHVTPALDELLAAAKAAVEHASAPATPATWKDIVQSVESASEQLSRAWSVPSCAPSTAKTCRA